MYTVFKLGDFIYRLDTETGTFWRLEGDKWKKMAESK